MNRQDTPDTPTDIVRSFMAALDDNDIDTATGYLDDTFVFSGWTPKPLDKAGFLDLIINVKKGIPGLAFNVHNVAEREGSITGTIHVTGYQTDNFAIPSLGTPPIPQTANSVSLPAEDVKYRLKESTLILMDVQRVQGGGIQGLLRQLGIDVLIVQ